MPLDMNMLADSVVRDAKPKVPCRYDSAEDRKVGDGKFALYDNEYKEFLKK